MLNPTISNKKQAKFLQHLTPFEWVVVCFVLFLTTIGIAGSHLNLDWFENVFAVEDGFVENMTLLPLAIAVLTGINYLGKFHGTRSKLFYFTISTSVIFCTFVIGEEISWGQRIFQIESSDYFLQNNAQKELNVHNLIVGGKKVNKIIFSQLMTLAVAFYLLIVPAFYARKDSWRIFLNRAGVPVPRVYQTITCLLLFLSISLIQSGKRAEILEVGITHIFMLIFLFPENIQIFRKQKV
nr:hypothetical protein [uncultured Dyadobacter sp.]